MRIWGTKYGEMDFGPREEKAIEVEWRVEREPMPEPRVMPWEGEVCQVDKWVGVGFNWVSKGNKEKKDGRKRVRDKLFDLAPLPF